MLFTLYSDCGPTKSSMDNPTYDENISVTPIATRIVPDEDDERLFQNPLYSDTGHSSSKKLDPHHPYEDIKMDTLVSTSYENVHGPGALSNEEFQNGNETGDNVSDSCYSALDRSTEYSTLEPHIPKPSQEQLPSTDDYSQLHHK